MKHLAGHPRFAMKSEVGSMGERVAAAYCVRNGLFIREQNYRKPYGEVDIVAEKGGIIHFIEVKTSKFFHNSAFSPEVRVNARKRAKLKALCETYLRETHVSQDQHWQIDVISVILDDDSSLREIKFFENAVFEKKY